MDFKTYTLNKIDTYPTLLGTTSAIGRKSGAVPLPPAPGDGDGVPPPLTLRLLPDISAIEKQYHQRTIIEIHYYIECFNYFHRNNYKNLLVQNMDKNYINNHHRTIIEIHYYIACFNHFHRTIIKIY